MKKLLPVIFLLIIPAALFCGQLYYDSSSNLYYKPVTGKYRNTSKDNLKDISSAKYAGIRTLNIFVYDPVTKESRYLFDDSFNESITDILFESEYEASARRMSYNNLAHIINNSGIDNRSPKSSIIVITSSESTGRSRMWKFNKRTQGGTVIHQFGVSTEWYYDTGNDRLLFFDYNGTAVTVTEKEW